MERMTALPNSPSGYRSFAKVMVEESSLWEIHELKKRFCRNWPCAKVFALFCHSCVDGDGHRPISRWNMPFT